MELASIAEQSRLIALQQYQILDSDSEQSFDDLAMLAAQICQTPIALINLISDDRQWFKAKIGIDITELPLEIGLCLDCLKQRETLIVPDAQADERWANNLVVQAAPYVRFYAGVPLITPTGDAIGTLCVIDLVPRHLTIDQIQSLEALGQQVITQLELRRNLRVLAQVSVKQKKVEESLRESEERFRTMADSAPVLLWTSGTDAGCTFFNQFWLDFTGRTPEQEMGNGWAEGVHPEDLAACLAVYQSAFESQRSFCMEYRLRRHDGNYRWILDTGVPRFTSGGRFLGYIGSCIDISDRKRAESELQLQNLSHQLFTEITLKIRQSLQLDEILQITVREIQKLLSADRVLIFQLHADGAGQVVQEAVLPPYTVSQGKEIIDHCFHQDYREKYRSGRVSAIADIQSAHIQACHRRFLQTFEVKANLVVPIHCRENLWGLLIAHQCNHPRQWSDFETELLQQLANQIGIAITQSQLLEQETYQRQELTRSNSELEQFAYVASHDLQEPLRMVISYLQLLERRYKLQLDASADEFINYAIEGAERMQILIRDLLIFSRVSTRGQPFTNVDSDMALKRAIANLQLAIQENEAVITHDLLPNVTADATQLTQLFQNLIGNALKFRRSEAPHIHIGVLSHNDTETTFYVSDRGIGIESQYHDRIFAIFQRLHSRSKYPGTGIGLALCKKIVERHGGRIWFESQPGQRTTFYFTLSRSSPSR